MKIEINCSGCNKICLKHKYEIEKRSKLFCSRSCANSFNNKLHPKRKIKEIKCKKCNKTLIRESYKQRRTYCIECHPNFRDYDNITLLEAKNKRVYQKNSRIRCLARSKYLKNNKNISCYNCGYSRHVEICHIQAIKDHKETDTIAYINRDENLIALCPNCHWELDNNLLIIKVP